MSVHYYCEVNCGGTDCDAPVTVTTTANSKKGIVVYLSDRGFEFKTRKEAAIDDIKSQPFYK